MQNGEGTVVSCAKGDFSKGGISSREKMKEPADSPVDSSPPSAWRTEGYLQLNRILNYYSCIIWRLHLSSVVIKNIPLMSKIGFIQSTFQDIFLAFLHTALWSKM